jgi:hypothetical protein
MISPSRTLFTLTAAVLLIASVSLPSRSADQLSQRGASPYDGEWSVVIQTTRGDCPAAIRAGVHISAGHVLPNDSGYSVEGRVAPNGKLHVSVSAGGKVAQGFGRLSRDAGKGFWRSQSGECSGQWTAVRRGQFANL